ncbi:MAG: purine-nucleoside phosphorylase [Ignavibacteria bacterium]|nr:purine-nucleoside phosphorylase [Ignavibacteria bacterium]
MKTKTGIILGSGLNKFAEELASPELLYEDNSSFHKLKVISGKINDENVVLFSGRRHFYEGYSNDKILENVNFAKDLGVNRLIITNAAGGINKNFKVSDLMLITSHYNFLSFNVNSSVPSLYSKDTISSIRDLAMEEKISLKYGSYCCLSGPSYESKSEIRFLNKIGVDAVGMSTVPEILYANKLGIKTIAISCITNMLSEQARHITNHEEVIEAGIKSYANFSGLLKKIILKTF